MSPLLPRYVPGVGGPWFTLTGALFSEGLIHGRSFLFQKLVSKRPGAYTRWGLLSGFYGIYEGSVRVVEV